MAYSNRFPSQPPSHQQGSALIVALVLLLVITLLAVAGMQNTVLQERMAGNVHDRNIAFQQAEAGLRNAQAQIPGNVGQALPSDVSPRDPTYWADQQLTDRTPQSYQTYVEQLAVPAESDCPEGEVCDDEFGAMTNINVFRITSLGVGGSPDAVVILQATVRSAQ
ncbi:PilX N-terminal domain-containing pilus assembly protein [Thioalkalivibrio sp. ALE17]|uniref:pilus assembly PilX family protein n=1 Tax=Thioalkalivibrio sp. ALE17 TaxID=1158173 RepID=UPI00056DE903|nr:PilX N-terminal domain-containing pilus assembly protein [Thioalkalivibrio sp. ALE17]